MGDQQRRVVVGVRLERRDGGIVVGCALSCDAS